MWDILWVLLLFLLLLFSWLMYRGHQYFRLHQYKGRTPPGIPPQWIVGNLRQVGIMQNAVPVFRAYLLLQSRFGDIFQFFLAWYHAVVICHPDDISDVFKNRTIYDGPAPSTRKLMSMAVPHSLVACDAITHRRHARIIRSILKKQKIIPFIPDIIKRCDTVIDAWEERIKKHGQTQSQSQSQSQSQLQSQHQLDASGAIFSNLTDHMQYLGIDLVGEITYGIDFGATRNCSTSSSSSSPSPTRTPSPIATSVSYIVHRYATMLTSGYPYPIIRLLIAIDTKWRNAEQILRTFVKQRIEALQTEEKNTNDMENENDNQNETTSTFDEKGHSHLEPSPSRRLPVLHRLISFVTSSSPSNISPDEHVMSQDEIMDELLFLIFAGSETVATHLIWFIYFMSKHPDIQQRLKEEIRDHIPFSTAMTCDMLSSLPYLNAVLHETLRLTPALSAIERYATCDSRIGEYPIRAGEEIHIMIGNVHRDPRFWSGDPEQFQPQRWYGQEATDQNHHAYAFIPFGGGHHACPGQEVARLELKLCMARMMQHVTFHDTDANTGGYQQKMTCLPKEMHVRITMDPERRRDR